MLRAWQHRGVLACLAWPLAQLHGWLTALRREAYRRGWRRAVQLPVPVVVVGNRIVGGAGKTPTVIALVEHLRQRGWRPGIVSRGHGGESAGPPREVGQDSLARDTGDEPLLLWRRAHVPVAVHRRRVLAVRHLLDHHPELDLIVADDGLQHLELRRDVDVMVFDDRGAGNGWLLPAGPLREPLRAPTWAPHGLVLYSAGSPSTPLPGHLGHRQLAGLRELGAWQARTPGPRLPLSTLHGRPVLACAGIARPQVFFDALRAAGLDIATLPLADHDRLDPPPWGPEVRDLVLTEKDAVKLDAEALRRSHPDTRVWVAALDFRIDDDFLAALDAALPEPPRHGPTTA